MSNLEVTPQQVVAAPWMAVVDIRPSDERTLLGFIPGSIRIDATAIQRGLDEHVDAPEVVLVCTSGRRAVDLIDTMPARAKRSRGVRALRGGVMAWRAAGLPTVCEDQPAEGFEGIEVTTPTEWMRVVLSCFVAEMLEDDHADDEEQDPRAVFDAIAHKVGRGRDVKPGQLSQLIDLLAAERRRRGGSLSRIAANVGAMRAMLSGI